jgi:hypothetical protein
MNRLRRGLTVATVVLVSSVAAGCAAEDFIEPPADAAGEGETGALGESGDTGEEAPLELEACTSVAASRPCGEADAMQFCDWLTVADELVLAWGECLDPVCMPGEQRECLVDYATCRVEEGIPYWPECSFTPLVLRFEPGPVELVSAAGDFDLTGVGACLDSDWPSPTHPWLAIDLDRNGAIDGGHELFGAATRLATGGRARHGFEALAALDHDHDGDVDVDDPGFASLLVWRDLDGDKRSSGLELTTLLDEGVTRLDLSFVSDERCDARGNCARERSSFEFRRGPDRRLGELVDVYLACD